MKVIRNFFKFWLRKSGYGLWAIDSSETLNFENLLYLLFRKQEVVTFLHLGAHDGKSFTDPLYNFIIKNPTKVSGVLVEPVAEMFGKLLENLGHIDTLRFLNVAIHPTLSEVTIHKLKNNSAGTQHFSTGLSTLDRSRLQSEELKNQNTRIVSEVVPAITLNSCIANMPFCPDRGPDVICIDTEGLDFQIVYSLDFEKVCPSIIRFEHNLCSTHSAPNYLEYSALVTWLNAHGYQVFTEHNDAVAVSRAMIPLITRSYEATYQTS
jgi:FkbM family methyltransferase